MPEGDSLHKLGRAIEPHLVGRAVTRLRLRQRGEVGIVRGHAIDRVEVIGKHLLVLIDRRWTVHLHLGLHGRWRGYAEREPSPAAIASSTLTLAVPDYALVVHRSMTHELVRYRDMRLEQRLRRLGPDLLAPRVDFGAIVTRARATGYADWAVADLLLEQRVASGIGNVYRSEIMFTQRIDPWRIVSDTSDDDLDRLFRAGQQLMSSNLGPGGRATVGPLRGKRRPATTSRFWVYRRAGLPCLRCQTIVRRSYQGRHARSTYWCPRCQPTSAP